LKKEGNALTFALIICTVCSLLLSGVSEGLRDRRELNQALDVKKNILKAVDLRDPLPKKASQDQVLSVFNSKIEARVIDSSGEFVSGVDPETIEDGQGLYPIYIYKENERTLAYCFPIVGKGLWSTLYGYFALEPDAKTVRGITFYQHGETPGLGAEIEADWFTSNFKGKKVWDSQDAELQPVAVVKGKVQDSVPASEQQHYVDGISGATMTSKGVTEMVERELEKYEPFFKTIRKI
jgi:Na+-transporting NADH:ubiquinone oxidoreductase subunit C